ncbi:MAG: hypothetical protein LUM44_17605 [Pyrinomonadaceae bacterium]|nr:hypothetical protein [Pyrinomonadaceae bacterium]
MEKQESMNIYDADAVQRYALVVTENGEKFDTAHVFNPLSDKDYLSHVNSVSIEGNADNVDANDKLITAALWDAQIKEVENIEVDPSDDWKSLIDIDEKVDAMNMFLTVVIVEPEIAQNGKRKLTQQKTETVITEAFFNGFPVSQTHTMQSKTLEFAKKYDKIRRKSFETEKTKGLSRKPKIRYVPQDEKYGELYDEMLVSSTGFKSFTPLRFKVKVIDYIFASKIDEKK